MHFSHTAGYQHQPIPFGTLSLSLFFCPSSPPSFLFLIPSFSPSIWTSTTLQPPRHNSKLRIQPTYKQRQMYTLPYLHPLTLTHTQTARRPTTAPACLQSKEQQQHCYCSHLMKLGLLKSKKLTSASSYKEEPYFIQRLTSAVPVFRPAPPSASNYSFVAIKIEVLR